MGPRVKQPERGVNHPTPTKAKIKEREELHLYFLSGLHGLFSGKLSLFYLNKEKLPYLQLKYLSSMELHLCFSHKAVTLATKVEFYFYILCWKLVPKCK